MLKRAVWTAAALVVLACAGLITAYVVHRASSAGGPKPAPATTSSTRPRPTSTTASTTTSTTTPTTSTTTSSTTTTQPPQRCTFSQLSVAVGHVGLVAHYEIFLVRFRNASQTACTLSGYPGLALADSTGRQVIGSTTRIPPGTSMASTLGVPVGTVVLQPGGFAFSRLAWQWQLGNPNCVSSTRLEITPPNASRSFVLPEHWQDNCSSSIYVQAVQPSSAATA